jgi:hypothetical protein
MMQSIEVLIKNALEEAQRELGPTPNSVNLALRFRQRFREKLTSFISLTQRTFEENLGPGADVFDWTSVRRYASQRIHGIATSLENGSLDEVKPPAPRRN